VIRTAFNFAIHTAFDSVIRTAFNCVIPTAFNCAIHTAFGCALALAAFAVPQASLAASTSPNLEPGGAVSAAAQVEGVAGVAQGPGVWFDGKQRQRYPVARLAELEPSLLLTVRAGSTERIRSAVAALGYRLDATRISGVFLLQIGKAVEPLATHWEQSAAGQSPLEVSLKLEGIEGIESIELNRRLSLRPRSTGR
jgi:hypothetical protein